MASTIKDIAKKLNISVSTVSYALNDGPRPVPEDVKRRVLQAAKDLQYRPNRVARNLVTRRSYTIGLVPSEASSNLMLSPYLQISLNGIVNTAEALHYDVLLFSRYDQTLAAEMSNIFLDGRADGLIFLAPPRHAPVLDLVAEHGIPHVVIAGHQRTGSAHFGVDNSNGVNAALDHLRGLGHHKIGHLHGRMHMDDGSTRRDAYSAYLAEHGLPSNDAWVAPGDFTIDGGYEGMKHILSHPDRPTAVVCSNDEVAVGAIRAAREQGLDVPGDLSVVGFDDTPLSAAFLPAVTTIRQPVQELASEATKALISLIDGSDQVPSRLFATELIVRDSTSRPKEDTRQ